MTSKPRPSRARATSAASLRGLRSGAVCRYSALPMTSATRCAAGTGRESTASRQKAAHVWNSARHSPFMTLPRLGGACHCEGVDRLSMTRSGVRSQRAPNGRYAPRHETRHRAPRNGTHHELRARMTAPVGHTGPGRAPPCTDTPCGPGAFIMAGPGRPRRALGARERADSGRGPYWQLGNRRCCSGFRRDSCCGSRNARSSVCCSTSRHATPGVHGPARLPDQSGGAAG